MTDCYQCGPSCKTPTLCAECRSGKHGPAPKVSGMTVEQIHAELKGLVGNPVGSCYELYKRLSKLIDQIPAPQPPDVVKECAAAYGTAVPTLLMHGSMRAALRRARELWGLPPLAELEDK